MEQVINPVKRVNQKPDNRIEVMDAFDKTSWTPATFGELLKLEKELLLLLEQYETTVKQAAFEYNPSVIAIYAFTVAKTFNTFYTEH
ncbi:MAG: hypothetical protein EOO00_10505, partial [Chitinophagaceae bacterium]